MTQLRSMTFNHDGAELVGQIAIPAAPGPHPAVMVMHNALGLGEQVRGKALELARLGYVGVATDMYGGGDRPMDAAAAGKHMMELRDAPQRLRARAAAWCEQLKARPEIDPQRIAAIGYCFGGLCVLELARSGADVRAVVSYHGLLTTVMPAKPGSVDGYIAIYAGGKDPYAPAEHIDGLRSELTDAGARFQITVFNQAQHAFTDPTADAMGRKGIAYDLMADRVSWAGTLALLEATLSESARSA